jgi:GAF domain-containing protein
MSNHRSRFAEQLDEVDKILAAGDSPGTVLQRLCNYVKDNVNGCDWVGFYLVVPGTRELALGPYAGAATEHLRIPFGRGICGRAAQAEQTIVVDDVEMESNYLSCSPSVQSEVVVPISENGAVVGELDIDSHGKAAFDEEKRDLLEKIADRCSDRVASLMFDKA